MPICACITSDTNLLVAHDCVRCVLDADVLKQTLTRLCLAKQLMAKLTFTCDDFELALRMNVPQLSIHVELVPLCQNDNHPVQAMSLSDHAYKHTLHPCTGLYEA